MNGDLERIFFFVQKPLSCVIFKLKLEIIKAFSNQFYQNGLVQMTYFREDIANLFTFRRPWTLNLSPSWTRRCAGWLSSTPQLQHLYDMLVSSARRSVPRLGTNGLWDGSPGEHLWCLCYCNCCSGFSFSCFKDWPWQWQRQAMI